jgi:hypothetical protein
VGLSCSRKPTTESKHEPWSQAQLIGPADLANTLEIKPDEAPVIFAVSPDGMYNLPEGGGIKNAVVIGPMDDAVNLEKLRIRLNGLEKDEEIVIYCGCCPFSECPNIRPAFRLLNEMGFKNHRLLNLPQNIQEDWISKGYPMNY